MLGKEGIKRLIVTKLLRRDLPLSLVGPEYKISFETKVLDDFTDKNGKVMCNINFDDLCPKYYDECGLDFGGNVEKGLSIKIKKLLEDYPHIALTIFVIPNCNIRHKFPMRLRYYKNRYDISESTHSGWLTYYKSLACVYNFEYAMHGCYHLQFENKFFGRHAEFAFKREEETRNAIAKGLSICKEAGLDVRGFRQPGWDINSDLSLCQVLKDAGFKYIAGSSYDAGFNAGKHRVSNYHPTLVCGILNFPQNIPLGWSIQKIRWEIDKIIGQKGIISIKGHFVDKGIVNCLSSNNLSKLRSILDYLASEYNGKVEYLSFQQIAEKI